MKTLAVLAIIWILYSMYRLFIKNNIPDDLLFGPGDFLYMGASIGFIGSIILIFYLIITYLP